MATDNEQLGALNTADNERRTSIAANLIAILSASGSVAYSLTHAISLRVLALGLLIAAIGLFLASVRYRPRGVLPSFQTRGWKGRLAFAAAAAGSVAILLMSFLILVPSQEVRCIDPSKKDPGSEYCVPIGRMFGRASGQPRVQVLSDQENTARLSAKIAGAQRSINAVALNGRLYLSEDQEDALDGQIGKIDIRILMFDPTDHAAIQAMYDDECSNGVTARYSLSVYKDQALAFAKKMGENNKFTLGMYMLYPWTRFAIFDDKSVSFIITPNTSGGKFTYKYYSDDPMIVEMFTRIFADFERDAVSRHHLFSSGTSVSDYVKQARPIARVSGCSG